MHEIMDYSGQAGEHFGKKQKQRAQLTCKGGGKGKGEGTSYIKQLGKWEVIREEIELRMPTRMSAYSRKVFIHGKAYKEVKML